MSNIKKISKYLLVIAIIVASLRLSILSLRFFLGTEYPIVTVEGTSMIPTFHQGDVLAVRGVDDSSIKLQDVIVFHEPYNFNKLIVHRVVQIITDSSLKFVTKGDNNPIADNWIVQKADIVGVVVAQLPPIASFIILGVESPAVTVFAVMIIIVVIGLEINDYRKPKLKKTS